MPGASVSRAASPGRGRIRTGPRRLADQRLPCERPAMAASGPLAAAAWFGAPNDKASVKVTFSADSGATFGAPIVVDQARPLGQVDVVLLMTKRARQLARRGREERPAAGAAGPLARDFRRAIGGRGVERRPVERFPRMLRAGSEVVIAWRDRAEPPRMCTAALKFESRGSWRRMQGHDSIGTAATVVRWSARRTPVLGAGRSSVFLVHAEEVSA